MEINSDTRLIDLTVAQLAEVIDKAVKDSIARNTPKAEPLEDKKWLVYGLSGIASLFGVSERQAGNIKRSGKISRAIRQQGRNIVVDAALALQLYGRKSS